MATDFVETDLASMSLDDLEALWVKPIEVAPPRGVYRGQVLRRIDHATSRRPLWVWSQRIGFEWIPFGVDFDRRLWFFFTPTIAMGRFETRVNESRWRDTDMVGLHYQGSKLPRFVRRVLYDEVKPLSERWILGIGGIDADRGAGEHFFFSLERME